MKRIVLGVVPAIFLCALVLACSAESGDDDDDGNVGDSGTGIRADAESCTRQDAGLATATSGVDPSKRVDALSDDEQVTLCDWDAVVRGGYCNSIACPNGSTFSNAANRAECLDQLAAPCAATVAELEACVKKVSEDVCNNWGSAECRPVVACSP